MGHPGQSGSATMGVAVLHRDPRPGNPGVAPPTERQLLMATPVMDRPVAHPEWCASLDDLTLDTTGLPGRFVVVHTLTTVAGVNLNRDFDNLPKRILVGGVERLRVSAQAKARAARTWTRAYVARTDQADRSRLLPGKVAEHLVTQYGRDEYDATLTAAAL